MRLAKALCVKRKFYRRRGKVRFEVNPFKFMTREILFKLQYTWIFQFVHKTGSGLPLPSPPLPSTTFHFCYPLQCISYQEHSLNNRLGYPSFLHKFETIIFANHKLKLSNIPCHNISRFVAKIYWWRQYITDLITCFSIANVSSDDWIPYRYLSWSGWALAFASTSNVSFNQCIAFFASSTFRKIWLGICTF